MKLYIDTTDRETIIIGIDDKRYQTTSKSGSSQKLLPFIDQVLKKNHTNLQNIQAIEVNIGPGSFTGIRVGVSVANALGYALGVPVNGKKLELEIHY